MTLSLLLSLLMGGGLALGGDAEFEAPVRLTAEGVPVRVESPGYAAPCWADIDGDGKKDLLVGQFNQGRSASTRTSATASSPRASGCRPKGR
jgi:hypothetical protein